MEKVKTTYEQIFNEIEGEETDTQIEWPNENKNLLCYPKFISKKQKLSNLKNEIKSNKNKNFQNNKFEQDSSKPIIKYVLPMNSNSDIQNEKNSFIRNSLEFKINDNNQIDMELNAEQLNFLEIENLKKLSKTELVKIRESMSLELLWIQQAIQSRMQVSFYKYLFQV